MHTLIMELLIFWQTPEQINMKAFIFSKFLSNGKDLNIGSQGSQYLFQPFTNILQLY